MIRRDDAAVRATSPESSSISIQALPATVWDRLTVIAGIPDWYDEWDRCEHQGPAERLYVGADFRLIRRKVPISQKAQCHVVALDEPRLIRWVETKKHRSPTLVEFRLASDGSGGTTLTHSKTLGRRQTRGAQPR